MSDDTLRKIMTFIDDHVDEISEGDYLDMCNKLSEVYKNEQTNTYNRNRVLPRSLQNDPYDTIYERCMVLVRKRKELKNLLKQLIRDEVKDKPLTDTEIAIKLEEKGYSIARRTVAKYRDELKIPIAKIRRSL